MGKRAITANLLQEFVDDMRESEKSSATIEKYLRDIKHFINYSQNKEIDKAIILEYKSYLNKNYAVSSANSMLAALNAFFRFIGWYDCCVKQFKVQNKTFYPENKELSKNEYLLLVRTAEKKSNERLSLLIQTICGTGIRVSEIKWITVEAVNKGSAIVSSKGKTRRIFIVSCLRKKLLLYAKEHGISSGMIFVTKSGNVMNRSNVWLEMKKLCKDAGIEPSKVFPHNLRHLFARTFYGIEKDISKLADILGHSNINTTRIYIMSTGAEYLNRIENMKLVI